MWAEGIFGGPEGCWGDFAGDVGVRGCFFEGLEGVFGGSEGRLGESEWIVEGMGCFWRVLRGYLGYLRGILGYLGVIWGGPKVFSMD